MTDRDERNTHGALTNWAVAFDALSNHGCDCGEDEFGTCLACVCVRALWAERERAERAEADIAKVIAQLKIWRRWLQSC